MGAARLLFREVGSFRLKIETPSGFGVRRSFGHQKCRWEELEFYGSDRRRAANCEVSASIPLSS